MKRKAIFLLYRLIEALLLPALPLYLLGRCLANRRYFATLRERFGQLPALWQRTAPEAIWFHAVSVGEVLCAVPLAEEIRRRNPAIPIFLSVSTLAGRATAEKRCAHATDGIFYAPFDLVWCVRRVLRRIRPSVLVILETEIWPNTIREARRVGCAAAIVNGRISDRALPRYRRFRWFFQPTLALCSWIGAQSGEMLERFAGLGAPKAILSVTGNLKYDFEPRALADDSPVHRFLKASERPLWIAASTAEEEEDIVIEAQQRMSGWRLVLAPRKPERFEPSAEKLARLGMSFTRRSSLEKASSKETEADVLLLDSIGELSGLFGHAAAVFMGGTIASYGGHNILEPSLFGKPVVAGPHLENFRDIEAHFETMDALRRVGSEPGADLAGAVMRAAAEPGLGERALAAAGAKQGASQRTADAVMKLYSTAYASARPAQPAWCFLWALAQVWRVASAGDRVRKERRAQALPARVISIGNITTGGTGKTPLTIELLKAFEGAGLLTRGYGRSSSDVLVWLDGEMPVALTGDEAQLYRHSVPAPIGIGADRYEAGRHLLEAAPLNTLFLDDGFQHLQLRRDFDLVVVDALNPFGGGHLLPLGRLREPLEGLRRADAFLIARSDEVANTAAIESVLHRYNPDAPVFRARTVARDWVNSAAEWVPPEELRGVRAVAFCGLGNPNSFWRTLRSLGIDPLSCHDYGDHHRYSPLEIRRLAQHAKDAGAQVLLTTSKDAVNLCSGCDELIGPLKLYWLEIQTVIEDRERMIRLLAEAPAIVHPGGTRVVEP